MLQKHFSEKSLMENSIKHYFGKQLNHAEDMLIVTVLGQVM